MSKRILREKFDALSEADKHRLIREGYVVVDSLEIKSAPGPAPYTGLTYPRSKFDLLSPAEQSAIIADGARLVD